MMARKKLPPVMCGAQVLRFSDYEKRSSRHLY